MDKRRVFGPKAKNTAQLQNIKGVVCQDKAFELYIKCSREPPENLITIVIKSDFDFTLML